MTLLNKSGHNPYLYSNISNTVLQFLKKYEKAYPDLSVDIIENILDHFQLSKENAIEFAEACLAYILTNENSTYQNNPVLENPVMLT